MSEHAARCEGREPAPPYRQDRFIRCVAFLGRMFLAAIPLVILGAFVWSRWWFWPLWIVLAVVAAFLTRPGVSGPDSQAEPAEEAQQPNPGSKALVVDTDRRPTRALRSLFNSCVVALVLLVAAPFMMLGLVTGSCQGIFYSDLPFDAAAWKEASPWKEGASSPRWRMREAVMDGIEPGTSKATVEAMLGSSENDWFGDSLMYHLGNRGQCFGHSDGPWLVVRLRRGKVTSVKVECTD